ncbi:MAG TPA: site-specific integrase [Armatimonadetes bacterium]|nr:site-specific integrase [Armatimonadota bacterium]
MQLINAARGDRFEALYTLALLTGMREGELLGLAWECVDLEAATLRVERSLAYIPKHGLVFGSPKSESSRRVLPLAPMAVAALKAHRERQEKEQDLQRKRWQEHGLVFPNTLGKPQDPTNFVMQRFRPLLKKAKLPQIRFHDLRHSTGSLLTALGVHHRVTQEILGHSSYVVTMGTYSHVAQPSQVEALNSLAQRLGG